MDRVDKILETIGHSLDTLNKLKENYEGKKKGSIYLHTVSHHTKKLRQQKAGLQNMWDVSVKEYSGVIIFENELRRPFRVIVANVTDDEFIKLAHMQTKGTIERLKVKDLKAGNLKFFD